MLFISYLTGDYLALYDVNLIRADSNNETDYFPTIYGLINKPPAEIDRSPLNLRGIKQEKLGTLFNRFSSIYHSNPLIFNLIVFHTQRSSIALEYKFITLVGALDSLVYRQKGASQYITKGEFKKKLVKPLRDYLNSLEMSKTNQELCNRVIEQIQSANTKVFKTMLVSVIEEHNNILPA